MEKLEKVKYSVIITVLGLFVWVLYKTKIAKKIFLVIDEFIKNVIVRND